MRDVAIVGAGAAGLGAAKAAMAKGLTFTVLEATSIAGGRARTDMTSLGVPYDLGCRSFYGDEKNPFRAFAAEFGTRLGPPPAKTMFHDGSRFLDATATDAAIADCAQFEEDLLHAHERALSDSSLPDKSHADVVESDNPSACYLRQSDHPSTAAASDVSVADPGCKVLATGGEEVVDGYGNLILRVAADVPVTTDCPVSAIDIAGRHVVLDTPKGQIDARAVLLTVSTAVLAAERIALRPGGWPDKKMAAIEAVPTGSVTKVGLRLKPGALPNEFTESQGDTSAGSVVWCSMTEPENICWLLGVGGGTLATAYIGGTFSRELALAGEDAQTDWALQHLCVRFGSSVKDAVMGVCATPFDRESWIDGGISYCRYGTGNQRPALAEPVEDLVFFAGEACSADYPGTAHGAWLSGATAIDRITEFIQ